MKELMQLIGVLMFVLAVVGTFGAYSEHDRRMVITGTICIMAGAVIVFVWTVIFH